jgi:pimeloyl-ACP methyl ester carboxylesterase
MVTFWGALLIIVVVLAVLIGLWLLALNAGATALLRRRPPDKADPPSNYGLAFEEVHFESRDGTKLFGWWIPNPEAIGTIVMCHGQTGSMDGDTHHAADLYKAGFSVFMFDFRAHGRSEGRWVTMGMYEKEDLLGALDFICEERNIGEVGVLGFSMGAAVALITAALSDRICAVVADSGYGRLKRTLANYAIARGVPGFIARPFAAWVLVIAAIRTEGRIDQSDPIRWTLHIGPRPILFIYGEDDCFVPMQDVDRMASLAKGPVEVWVVDDAGHRGAYKADPAEYNRRVTNFFKANLPEAAKHSEQVEETAK